MWGRKGAGARGGAATAAPEAPTANGANGNGKGPGIVREASHAGSWYTANGPELDRQLSSWLQDSGVRGDPAVRAVIAPHAGYRYSGRCAAYAFGHIDPASISRIFVMGPSHHHFTRRCMLTTADVYSTPLGDIDIDRDTVERLRATGAFEDLPLDVDEAEHSVEMHLSYLVKLMGGRPFTLVPIVVGSLKPATEEEYGKILAPFLEQSENFFSVSTDFCHWGSRFNYTPHDRSCGAIHESIEAMDREGMGIIERGDCKAFTKYLRQTENTICGRHPVGVLLSMLEHSELESAIRFVQYEQSSRCTSTRDSSVSYASGIVSVSDASHKKAKTATQ